MVFFVLHLLLLYELVLNFVLASFQLLRLATNHELLAGELLV